MAVAEPTSTPRRTRYGAKTFYGDHTWLVWRTAIQATIVAVFLLAWQLLPEVAWLADRYRFLNRFFISSPADVWGELQRLITGDNVRQQTVWPYLRVTLLSTVIGASIGIVLGGFFGLVFSNSEKVSQVVRPFAVLGNSIPRVALIPIFIVIAGATMMTSVLVIITVVFFLAFFNAFEGGRSIPTSMMENAQLLGAGRYWILRRVRLPMVLTWTFAAIPNAISFGLVTAVTAEILSGVNGMGRLIQISTQTVNSGLTIAVVVILSIAALLLYGAATLLRDALIRWEPGQ
jgi:NitT/TauT family transport system permease protein